MPSSSHSATWLAAVVLTAAVAGVLVGGWTAEDPEPPTAAVKAPSQSPAATYRALLVAGLGPLAESRGTELERLSRASRAGAQARSALAVSRAYRKTADGVVASQPPPGLVAAAKDLGAALRAAERAYAAVADAARSGRRPAYEVGRRRVREAEQEVRRTLAATLGASEAPS